MNSKYCSREAEVLAAERAGSWPPELQSHFAACSACAEAVLTRELLRGEFQAALAEAELSDAGQVWWKAQLRARQAAAQRALVPVRVVETISLLIGLLLLVFAAARYWPQAAGWLGAFSRQTWSQPLSLVCLTSAAASLVVASAALSYMLVADH